MRTWPMRPASTPSSAAATPARSRCSPSFGAGVGSTIGLLAAPLAFDFVRTAVARVRALDWAFVGRLLEDMEHEGRDLLRRAGGPGTEIGGERAADMRLIGQAHEITV